MYIKLKHCCQCYMRIKHEAKPSAILALRLSTECLCYSYTMGMNGLPDMYTQSLRVYISGKPRITWYYNCYVP